MRYVRILTLCASLIAAAGCAGPGYYGPYDYGYGSPGYYGPYYDYYGLYDNGYYGYPYYDPFLYDGFYGFYGGGFYGGYGCGGVVAVPAPIVPSGGGVAYCEAHFRSYNPATGMYLGYDGRHHPCP